MHRNTHDPTFSRGIEIEHAAGSKRQYRFTLYDLDSDEIVLDSEIIGQVIVDSETLASGTPVELALEKDGKAVEGCSILLNSPLQPTVVVLSTAESSEEEKQMEKFDVSLSCR